MTTHTMDTMTFGCGCRVSTPPQIKWCPLHAAAEEMRAMLENISRICTHAGGRTCASCQRARALLAKVGG